MTTHHWIHNHCTECGVKREKVRVQGPCKARVSFDGIARSSEPARLDAAFTGPQISFDEALATGIQVCLFKQDAAPLRSINEHYAALDPRNIKHVVAPASQSDPDAFKAKVEAETDAMLRAFNAADLERKRVLYGGDTKPYSQNPLFEIVPQTRSIEPHKKRREK